MDFLILNWQQIMCFSIKKVKAKSFYPASKQTQGHGF